MDRYLKDFEVESKNPSEENIRRWRKAVSLVKNPRRRFRFVADLAKRDEAEKKKRQIQEKIPPYVQKAALQFKEPTWTNVLKDFEVESKNPSEETIRRWRKAVSLVKNPRRRFRFVADLAKRDEAEKKKRQIQEKIRVARDVQKPALQFIDAGAGDRSNEKPGQDEYKLSEDARTAGFSIHADELASITRRHDIKALKMHGGIHGILRKVSVSLDEGVKDSTIPIRQNVYGINRYTEKPPRTFFVFVWEALQGLTLIILYAVVSIGVGIATEGWPEGMYDGLRILISIILAVMVTAISDYRQSLQFKDLDREKKKIFVQVTRDKKRQKFSIYDLVVGDIVHLSIGEQVPADGFFISGYSLLIDESSLSGESEPVNVYEEKPLLFAGTKVQDGSGIMVVTTVGMRTEWGKLMETLSEGGEDETPLQVKLNGVATIIGKIGLTNIFVGMLDSWVFPGMVCTTKHGASVVNYIISGNTIYAMNSTEVGILISNYGKEVKEIWNAVKEIRFLVYTVFTFQVLVLFFVLASPNGKCR